VRDMALRKGKPRIVTEGEAATRSHDRTKATRKGKPSRLDLSKLFPKPRGGSSNERGGPLLSPTKLVDSPSALSTVSDYFPTPSPLQNNETARRPQTAAPPRLPPSSPERLFTRDPYDNAKINVRRPPRGIKYWFDGLGEDDSDEDRGAGADAAMHTPTTGNPTMSQRTPVRNNHVAGHFAPAPSKAPLQQPRRGVAGQAEPFYQDRLHSPGQHSPQSRASTRSREAIFSRRNLMDSSVLSMSSSDGEEEIGEAQLATDRRAPRDCLSPSSAQYSEIFIGKAQALDVRPRNPTRPPSESKLSLRSTSTTAATIEVMYSPEPYPPAPGTFPGNNSRYGGSRRSSHVRQPSVIHEDEVRPQTSNNARPMSPSASVHSGRTSQSDPRPRADQHKLMAVTEEEEALLEMMRRKRAAMAQQSFTEGYKTAIRGEQLDKTPPKAKDGAPRTSAFLSMDSPLHAPVTSATVGASRKSLSRPTSPLLLPVPRHAHKKKPSQNSTVTTMTSGGSHSSTNSVEGHGPNSTDPPSPSAFRLSVGPEFSPLDPFFPPGKASTAASIASPATSHASPLPSPVTPGLRHGEVDLQVEVVGSDGSIGDEDVPVNPVGVIESLTGSIKSSERENSNGHQRRRTASSGAADVSFTTSEQPSSNPPSASTRPTKTKTVDDLPQIQPLPETHGSIYSPGISTKTGSRRSSRRASSINTTARSRHSSVVSTRTSSPASNGVVLSRPNSLLKDGASTPTIGTRCSVSEDVLAAWGSLGGWRDYDSARIG
jgi:hypothetical protein